MRERAAAGTIIAGDISPPGCGTAPLSGRDRVTGGNAGAVEIIWAGAITMLTVRLGSVISPVFGGTGQLPAAAWHGTMGWRPSGLFITIAHTDAAATAQSPLRERGRSIYRVAAAFRFCSPVPLIGGIALLGGLVTIASAVRASSIAGDELDVGGANRLLYAAIPLGAAIGALTGADGGA